jgi:hypothetical protein
MRCESASTLCRVCFTALRRRDEHSSRRRCNYATPRRRGSARGLQPWVGIGMYSMRTGPRAPRAYALVLLLTATMMSSPASSSERDLQQLLEALQSSDEEARASAAKKLRYEAPPPIEAVGPLLAAAEVEDDMDALCEMLITLGESGMTEALGLLQTHAQSPVDDVRTKARRGLKRWLVRNRILAEHHQLPDPPHPFYLAPPRMPPDRPGGHSLFAWQVLARDDDAERASRLPPPRYRPADADGLPAGYRLVRRSRHKMMIAGGVVFGSVYMGTVASAAVLSHEEYPTVLLIPIIGPSVHAASYFERDRGMDRLGGMLLVVDAVAQLAGVVVFGAGVLATRARLMHQAPEPARAAKGSEAWPEVVVSAGGGMLCWRF